MMDRTKLELVLAKETPQERVRPCQPAMEPSRFLPEMQITK
jgi:hypothetical protein